jgi:hypothetical protein
MPVDSERRRRWRGARWFCQRASWVLAAAQSRGRRGEEGLKVAVHAEGEGVVEAASAAALDYGRAGSGGPHRWQRGPGTPENREE